MNSYFLPYVGKEYQNGIEGKRVLVLGQSHYCDNESCTVSQNMTNELIQEYLHGDFYMSMNTLTKFIRALSGENIERAESSSWWDKVMFYNYVQKPMSRNRSCPPDEDFESSADAFFSVLEKYQPDVAFNHVAVS